MSNGNPWAVRVHFVQLLVSAGLLLAGAIATYNPLAPDSYIVRAAHPAFPFVRPYTFPAGGRSIFPDYRLVALYGTPGTPVLGSLGQQPLDETIERVKELAAQYQPLTEAHILPSLEIITTVASASPMATNDYSNRVDKQIINQWISEARENGVYVVLDLQPGRTSFVEQAKECQTLLEQPNVGLALDPEWRLGPAQRPVEQIGTVDISEVNQTASWLADLTKQHKLPQKLFLLHQFRLSMISNRQQLDTSRPELAYAIQMDGQGSQEQKLATWQVILADAPAGVRFGWKNFYVKDTSLRSPQDTMTLDPQPWYVSYQ